MVVSSVGFSVVDGVADSLTVFLLLLLVLQWVVKDKCLSRQPLSTNPQY